MEKLFVGTEKKKKVKESLSVNRVYKDKEDVYIWNVDDAENPPQKLKEETIVTQKGTYYTLQLTY
jgi:hypothetical protein